MPALSTCVKMLREGDERAKALLLLAGIFYSLYRKLDEIRIFSNKELRLTKEYIYQQGRKPVNAVDRSGRNPTVTCQES